MAGKDFDISKPVMTCTYVDNCENPHISKYARSNYYTKLAKVRFEFIFIVTVFFFGFICPDQCFQFQKTFVFNDTVKTC